MVKHTQTICWQSCRQSVFDHFVGLALKELRILQKESIPGFVCVVVYLLKNSLNTKVKGLDRSLQETNGAAIINLVLFGFLCNFNNQYISSKRLFSLLTKRWKLL